MAGTIAIVAVLVLIYLFLFRALLTLVLLGAASVALIQQKLSHSKKKGVNRLGRLDERLTFSVERLVIGEKQFECSQLEKFEIDAADFVGKDFWGISPGVGNYIEFTHQGTEYAYQFQVKRPGDLKLLSQLEKAILTSIRR